MEVKKLFTLSDRAYQCLKEVIQQEQGPDELLFVRLTMGMG